MKTEFSTKSSRFGGGDEESSELDTVKKSLENYREVLIPLNKVIEWDQSYYPAVLVGIITLIFSIIWYLEPSVLTTVCLFVLVCCITDFAMPTVSAQLARTSAWSEQKGVQYEQICVRLCNAKRHFSTVKQSMLALKHNKPNVYLVAMMGTFATLAWFGSLIDNLLLVYLIVVAAMLVPGLRKHGVLQKAVSHVTDKVANLRKNHTPQAAKSSKVD